jgi:hypothetical protein
MSGLNFAHAHICVRHRQRTASAIAGGARISACRVGTDPQPRAIEMQNGAATGRHRVDRHHRRAHPHAGDLGFEGALETAGIQRHIGRGAAHVEADDRAQTGHLGSARGPDDPARRAGQNGVLALKRLRLGKASARLHEQQPNALQLGRHLVDIPSQDRRQIGVDDGGITARHQPQQRTDRVARRHLAEAGLDGQRGQPLFVGRIFPGMHQDDRDRVDAGSPRLGKGIARRRLVERLHFGPVHADAAGNFDDPLIQQARQRNRQVEQPRARLVADPQRVGEPRIDQQQHRRTFALEQRVGGDRGAHLHALDHARRDRRVRRHAQHLLDAGYRRVRIAGGVLAQQLVAAQATPGVTRDEVGECAAAIDPELPACHTPCCPVGHVTATHASVFC